MDDSGFWPLRAVTGVLLLGGGLLGTAAAVRAAVRQRRLPGGRALARVVDTLLVGPPAGSWHAGPERLALLEFRTPEGRLVRLRDTSGELRLTGDLVVVRHPPGEPERAVCPPPGESADPVPVVLGLVVCAVCAAVGALLVGRALLLG
ncbi:hypothetical protein [Streptomyces sp. DT18]